jgi:hypothetical protein
MRERLAVSLLPALLFLALHARALDYGFVWVDEAEIAAGSILRPPGQILAAFGEPLQQGAGVATAALAQPYYRPLQVVTASALAAGVGRVPRAFHALSLALGAATAALFGALALRLLRQPGAALLAGCLFAAHPGLLEIYVWVAGLSAALLGLFLIASLLCGLRAQQAGSPRARLGWGAASLAGLAAALLSKENAAVAPALLLVLGAATRWRARCEGLRDGSAAALAALVGAQALLVALYLLLLRPAVLGTTLTGAAPIGGSLASQWQTSLAQWPSLLAWLFAPLRSGTSDAVRIASGWGDPATLGGVALALGSALACIGLIWRGHALAAAALAWIWIGFLPTSGLAPLLHARAERNLFLPLFGAALLGGCAFAAVARTRLSRAAAVAAALLLVLGLAQRTSARSPDWRSTLALFERDVAADPRHREGRMNLIVALVAAGRGAEAKQHMEVLAAQRPADEGWHSYLLEPNLHELICLVNAAAGDDADTLRRFPPRALAPSELWLEAGFYACYAGALERSGRCADALPIYAALYRGSGGGAEGVRFAQGAARCAAAQGQDAEVARWRARIPADGAPAGAYAPAP